MQGHTPEETTRQASNHANETASAYCCVLSLTSNAFTCVDPLGNLLNLPVAVTQLPVIGESPAPQGTLVGQSQGVHAAASHLSDECRAQSFHEYWNCLNGEALRSVTELSATAIAPGVDGAGLCVVSEVRGVEMNACKANSNARAQSKAKKENENW